MTGFIDRLNADDMLSRFGAYYTTRIQIICDAEIHHFDIKSGQVSKGDSGDLDGGFSLTGSNAVWEKYCADTPPPEHHEFAALLANGHITVNGDIYAMQSNVMYVRRLLELWRIEQRRVSQQ